jgi:hypothetical protein
LCHDATERPIPRPTDPVEQTLHSSGKAKAHTLKNVLLVNSSLHIVFLSTTFDGRVHDTRIADDRAYPLPAGSQLLQALGFLACTLDEVTIHEPIKKPRGGHLTPEQKTHNRVVSRRRVRIEHVTSSVKRCRMVKDAIRLWRGIIRDLVIEVACGLHNFRLRLYSWQPLT